MRPLSTLALALLSRTVAIRLVPPQCNSSLLTYDFSSEYYRNIFVKHTTQIKTSEVQLKYTYGKIEMLRSGSGPGSATGDATSNSLHFLKEVIPRFNIKSVVDAPCGDVTWQFQSWEMDSLELYLGIDVVNKVIHFNDMRFAHHKNKAFAAWDFVSCGIPKYRRGKQVHAFDMVHMRDVLQHLSVKNGLRAIDNVCKSGATYLVATTYPTDVTKAGYATTKIGTPERAAAPRYKVVQNDHPHDGGWYPNNLALPPFNFPQGLQCVETHPTQEPDHTCIYRIRDIPLCAR